jgi:hypothetical protein
MRISPQRREEHEVDIGFTSCKAGRRSRSCRALALTSYLLVSFAASVVQSGPPAAAQQGHVYYVAPQGNDSGPGTLQSPWLTLDRAARSLNPGDTVYLREGTYRERLIPLTSGSEADGCITYASYPGEVAILYGQDIQVPVDEGLVHLGGREYIRIQGLHVLHSAYAGILADGCGHIIIEGNRTYDSTSSGIGVWDSHDVTVAGNEVELSCLGGWQEALTVAGTDGFAVYDNHVHNEGTQVDKEGICLKDGSRHGMAYRNHVHHMGAVGIYLDAWDKHTYDMEIFQNVVHDCAADGFALASEMGGLLEDVWVYNNVAYRNLVGLWVSGCCSYGPPTHPLRGLRIVNNTFYDNGRNGWGGGIGVDVNPNVSDVLIRNNLCSQNLYFQIAVDAVVPAGAVTVDHNLVDGYRDTEGELYGENAVQGDPLFVNLQLGNLRLRPGSPAVDRGSPEGAPANDYDGRSRPQDGDGDGVAVADIGAFELQQLPARLWLPLAALRS